MTLTGALFILTLGRAPESLGGQACLSPARHGFWMRLAHGQRHLAALCTALNDGSSDLCHSWAVETPRKIPHTA